MPPRPTKADPSLLRIHPEVADALAQGRAVVALETTLLAHGLPRPLNLQVGRELEAVVRAVGAIPATIGVLAGVATVGLTDAELERLAGSESVAKLSDRDLAPAMARGCDGATTVAATVTLAAWAGIRVMATGGLGGVHRGAARSWDVSADLAALRREQVLVVAAGVKSVLDVGATLEQLETLGVPVIGYRSHNFAGFLTSDSGWELSWSVDDPAAAAAVAVAHWALGCGRGGILLSNPIGPGDQLDPAWHDRLIEEGLASVQAQAIRGPATTPFLLRHLERSTGGESVRVNRLVVLANAELGARIARALVEAESSSTPR
jgi:pseudouridine-5'-phosphate glycosidase